MHENSKKAAYNARVLEVEKGTFTPIVFSTTGGMVREAHNLFKNIAEKMSNKSNWTRQSASWIHAPNLCGPNVNGALFLPGT